MEKIELLSVKWSENLRIFGSTKSEVLTIVITSFQNLCSFLFIGLFWDHNLYAFCLQSRRAGHHVKIPDEYSDSLRRTLDKGMWLSFKFLFSYCCVLNHLVLLLWVFILKKTSKCYVSVENLAYKWLHGIICVLSAVFWY